MKTDYNWLDIEVAVRDIADQIKKSEEDFCCIVAPVRGGLIPGVMLSHLLGIPLFPISYSLRDHKSQQLEMPELVEFVQLGGNVVVIDDIIDGGHTMMDIVGSLYRQLPLRKMPRVHVAALLHNTEAPALYPVFSYMRFKRSENQQFFTFPWELIKEK